MINLKNLFGGAPTMGTSLFGAPKMFEDMPEPGMPATGAPDGVAPPPTSMLGGFGDNPPDMMDQRMYKTPMVPPGGGGSNMPEIPGMPNPADIAARGATPTGLGGSDKDFFVPPGSQGAAPPPAGPPVPIPQPSLKPIPPSAASQLPPPATGPGSDRATAATPGPVLPLATQGGIGPDQPVAPVTDPATTGGAGETPPGDEGHKNTLADFLERAGQVKFGGGASGGGGGGGGSVGSAGAPHIPQGASQLFQDILAGHQKMTPQAGPVPKLPDYLNRLGLTGRR